MTCSHSLSNSECNPGICCPNFPPLIHISAGTRHLTSVVILKSHQLVAQDRTSFRTHLCASTHLSHMGVTKLKHLLTGTHKYICKNFLCHVIIIISNILWHFRFSQQFLRIQYVWDRMRHCASGSLTFQINALPSSACINQS